MKKLSALAALASAFAPAVATVVACNTYLAQLRTPRQKTIRHRLLMGKTIKPATHLLVVAAIQFMFHFQSAHAQSFTPGDAVPLFGTEQLPGAAWIGPHWSVTGGSVNAKFSCGLTREACLEVEGAISAATTIPAGATSPSVSFFYGGSDGCLEYEYSEPGLNWLDILVDGQLAGSVRVLAAASPFFHYSIPLPNDNSLHSITIQSRLPVAYPNCPPAITRVRVSGADSVSEKTPGTVDSLAIGIVEPWDPWSQTTANDSKGNIFFRGGPSTRYALWKYSLSDFSVSEILHMSALANPNSGLFRAAETAGPNIISLAANKLIFSTNAVAGDIRIYFSIDADSGEISCAANCYYLPDNFPQSQLFLHVGGLPYWISAPNGKIYMNSDLQSLLEIDFASQSYRTLLRQAPADLAADKYSNVYFTSGSSITRISGKDGSIEEVRVTADGSAIYEFGKPVIDRAGVVYIISTSSGDVLKLDPYDKTLGHTGFHIPTYVDPNYGELRLCLPGFQIETCTFDDSGNLLIARHGKVWIAWSIGTKVTPDVSPPTIAYTTAETPSALGWFNTDVHLSWDVTDGESAVTSTSGCESVAIVDDTAGRTFTCTATSGGGTATVSYTVRRDTANPLALATRSPFPNSDGWNNTAVNIKFSGLDGLSAIADCSADALLSTEGASQTSPSGTCTDSAGNLSEPASISDINIDLTAPDVQAVIEQSPNASGWYNQPLNVAFAATDMLSGVHVDGCSSNQVFIADGTDITASGTCRDKAGNVGMASVSGLKLDRTPPIAAFTVSPAANAANWHRTAATITFSGTDSMSGSGLAGCSTAASVSADGAAQVRSGTCTDVAGNTSNTISATVNVDTTAPTVAVTAPVSGGSYMQNSVNTANYTCADALSGILGCLGTVPTGNAFSTSTVGANSFTVQATDVAGNTASRTVSYTVTATSPFTLLPTALVFGDRLVNSSATLSVTVLNTGTSALALTVPTLSGANANQFTLTRTCGTSLAAGASCKVAATFKPTSAGAKTAAFSMRVGTATQTVPLSGTGVVVTFTVSPTSLAFGNQARNTTSAKRSVTVSNTTALPITLSALALSGTNANQFLMTRNCGTTLAANATCTVDVQFKPTSTGSKRASLTVTPSGATAKVVALTGTGM